MHQTRHFKHQPPLDNRDVQTAQSKRLSNLNMHEYEKSSKLHVLIFWLKISSTLTLCLLLLLQLRMNSTTQFMLKSSTELNKQQRLLIGILTTAKRFERRSTLRALYAPFLPLTPKIDLRFVIAKDTEDGYFNKVVEMEQARYKDIIYLEIDENMNSGKTYQYFKHVHDKMSEKGYTFVFKADDDAFIHLPHLWQRFEKFPTDSTYWGILVLTKGKACWLHYMCGPMYGVSWDLVSWIATDPLPTFHLQGHEDWMVSSYLMFSLVHGYSKRIT